MCIRDSFDTDLAGVDHGESLEAGIYMLNFHDLQAIHKQEPVSYTHLRAHETVLDLVCRLLLEKKKKLIPYHHLSVHDMIHNNLTNIITLIQVQSIR